MAIRHKGVKDLMQMLHLNIAIDQLGMENSMY